MCVIAFFAINTMAQKPVDGYNHSLETGLNLDGTTMTSPELRYRYFFKPNMAVRVGLGIMSSKTTNNFYENPDFTGGTGSQEMKSFGWSFMPGFEYHLEGTEQLSPYLGAALMIGGGSSSENWENFNGVSYSEDVTSAEINNPYSSFGFGILGGCDFYFAENIFIGAEVGFGSSSTTNKEGDYSITSGGTTTSGTTNAESKNGGASFGANGSIRVGWRL